MSTGYCPPADHPIFVDGVALNTSGSGQHGAVGVRVKHIMGWIAEGVEVRDTREAKPGRDGEHADEQFLGGRTITFEGHVTGSTYANLQSRKQTLAATFERIAYEEGVVKLPDPDTAAPSFTHADTMTGFERVEARLVGGGVTWGERFGVWGQRFSVSVRASDPLIYSDTEITDTDGVIAAYGGTTATPVVIEAEWSSDGTNGGFVYDGEGLLVAARNPTLVDLIDGTTVPKVRIDTANRSAALMLPHAAGRLALLSPIALWKFDEAAGSTADNAQGTATYDGAYVNTPTLNQAGPYTDSKSVLLDGVNEHVTVAWNTALHPAEWTLEGRFKTSHAGPTFRYVADWTTAADRGFAIQANTTGVRLLASDSSSVLWPVLSHRYVAVSTDWHHVAVTYKDGCFSFFVDGVRVGRVAFTYLTPTTGTMYFGAVRGLASTMPGNLSTWALYGSALGDAHLAEIADVSARYTSQHKARTYISAITRWPEIAAAKTFVDEGDFGAVSYIYREARL